MSSRDRLASFAQLLALQELATLGQRERFSVARDGALARGEELRRAERLQASAGAHLDSVFAGATLCVDRLGLAASELSACDQGVTAARSALSAAQADEETARLACLEANKRLEWTAAGARERRRRHRSRREEAVLRDAVGLCAIKAAVR